MPTTPVYSLRYPGPDDAPNGPTGIQNLAEDIEATLSTLVPNSGVVTSLAVTAGAGWAVNINQHQTIGKKMWLYLQLERTGTAVTASGSTDPNPGNIVGDPVVATITDASKRPTMDAFGAFRASLTAGSMQCNAATGEVKIADAHSGSTIETAAIVHVFFAYPIP